MPALRPFAPRAFSRTARASVSLCLTALLLNGLATPAIGAFVPPPPEPPPAAPPSLKALRPPVSPELADYVADRDAAIALGKALFWDMQVGSDGVQACASCHFQAGADDRSAGQLNPGANAGDTAFSAGNAASSATAADFPFHRLADPASATSTVLFDTNDVFSSQGVLRAAFGNIRVGYAAEWAVPGVDPVFSVAGVRTRQVPPRNSPSVINAAYNLHNFWDGRANEVFNGETPFGAADPDAGVYVDTGTGLAKQKVRIRFASLASQAVGPLVSDVEMRAAGRSRAMLGRKMYGLRPLGKQMVHPNDSVLGPLSRARLTPTGDVAGQPGLRTWYPELIKTAFKPQYWNSSDVVRLAPDGSATVTPSPGRPLADDEFTQMEANLPLFFGLSVMMYESTLISDDAPFDRWREGDAFALTAQQKAGFNLFMDPVKGRCAFCHGGPEFTNATTRGVLIDGRVELMSMLATGAAFYDIGFYNLGVRPQTEDAGRGGSTPFPNALTGQPIPLADARRGLLKRDGQLPAYLSDATSDTPPGNGWPDPLRTDSEGAFKTPGLRNVELTGPYFHNGGFATLKQVVEFYERGGDFGHPGMPNHENIPPIMHPTAGLTEADTDALVAFMLALTDERVKYERAPFDHPQLFLPNGRALGASGLDLGARTRVSGATGFERGEFVRELPAVGSGGRLQEGLPPLVPFLGLDPFTP